MKQVGGCQYAQNKEGRFLQSLMGGLRPGMLGRNTAITEACICPL